MVIEKSNPSLNGGDSGTRLLRKISLEKIDILNPEAHNYIDKTNMRYETSLSSDLKFS